MKRISLPIVLVLCFSILSGFTKTEKKKEDYKNPKLSVEERVEDLLSRMTVDEKLLQLQSQMVFFDQYKDRNFTVGHTRNFSHFLTNSTTPAVTPKKCAEAVNADTKNSMEANRFGIPVMQHGEALHGAQCYNATCFPQSIGVAASFDDDLYYREGQMVAKELRAIGVRQVYAPVINLVRDVRWGRTQESYGEDVFLSSKMGVAYVKALQEGGVIATPKHFVDNYADGGHDSWASNSSWRLLHETYLEPFRACFQEGGAMSVMAAYNSVDGRPCTASHELLTGVLRDEWNFKGYVVSDYGGVFGVHAAHRVAETPSEGAAQSLEAGMELELPTGGDALVKEYKAGRISEEVIDTAVRRVLRSKFAIGLFDEPFADATKANDIIRNEEHKEMALEVARKVMTLFKNENNTLPLNPDKLKKVGLFGPAANIVAIGNYSGPYGGWKVFDCLTPYQALQKALAGKAEVVLYPVGYDMEAAAKECDAVIYFASIAEGEGGDRSTLNLPASSRKLTESMNNAIVVEEQKDINFNEDQEESINILGENCEKSIVVLVTGSAIDMKNWIDNVDAVMEAWYPGEQGGIAIAETLLGKNNPGGRTPLTWPLNNGQLPLYYAIKPSGRGYEYNDNNGKPFLPFGYGLSYTTFEYSNFKLPAKGEKGKPVFAEVIVTNTGNMKGDEVVQLYVHDEFASVVRPMKELKAYKRVTLEPGESKVVKLELPYRSFGLYNEEMDFVVEPGDFEVWLGKNAEEKVEDNNITMKKIYIE